MGIENGHLPETVSQRSIRIGLDRQSQDELDALGIEPFYMFDVEDEAADLQERLSAWAKENSMVLRDYRPRAPKGLTARQWEISRTMVQLAHALGMEDRIIKSLLTVLGRHQEVVSAKTRLYSAVDKAFTESGVDRLPSKLLLAGVLAQGVNVPGNSAKGMSNAFVADGIGSQNVRISAPKYRHMIQPEGTSDHPRGYYRHQFDEAIIRYVPEDDE